ncbi:MAG: hypothetical protein RLY57_173 [Candidatus Parcubacteria bacterium]|jgi:hypothetical protein
MSFGIGALYLGLITVGMVVVYSVLYVGFQKIFTQKYKPFSRKSCFSIVILTILSIATYYISFNFFTDPVLGNRFLHAFGGGFVLFLVAHAALQDAGIVLKQSTVFITGFMIVTLLGLFNEVLEAFLQQHVDFVFAPSLTDTLLDLVSNTVGFIVAYLVSLKSNA